MIMEIKKEQVNKAYGVQVSAEENGQRVGRALLYVLYNGLHEEPFGFLEDIFVEEAYRGKGLGNQLLETAINEAKSIGCYKLIATSRFSRPQVHEWYERKGFMKHGAEFRMDLI
ncbi:GNAT family N-acetyltransferase [Patescibacteria group bacterium]|nr:MAG: GNAT family N-acetyltransferase [Patescibacteria group bacterium]